VSAGGTSLTLAVLGTGTMGAPMARRCAASGLAVRAWNRTREKAEPLGEHGVTVCDSPADAARDADVVMTMLADADAVLGVAGDALHAARAGCVWLQASTIGLDGIERCAAVAEEHRAALVDAPVLGTKQPAEEGKLVVLASGQQDALECCRPVFEAVGQRTMHLGDAGMGTRLKLAVNAWLVAVTEGFAETAALAEGLGLRIGRVLEAIEGGPLELDYARIKGAMMDRRDFPPSFALHLARKDADLVVAAAERAGLDLPLPRTVAERLARAQGEGHGEKDMAATFLTSAPAERAGASGERQD
jgi:3-hydroxyisobutyrate dehydrogenase